MPKERTEKDLERKREREREHKSPIGLENQQTFPIGSFIRNSKQNLMLYCNTTSFFPGDFGYLTSTKVSLWVYYSEQCLFHSC